jgi:GPH family glycoside/pentoside/hexuronide:cation symporter
MLWWRPALENPFALTAYYATAYFFYDTLVTLTGMPYLSLTPELTQDYDERTSLTSYRMAFSLFGGLVAFVVPLMMIGTMRPENADKVFQMGWIFAVASALPLLITFIGTREKEEYTQQVQPSLRDSLKAARNNRPFIFAAGIFLFTWTAIEIIQNMLLLTWVPVRFLSPR